MRKKLTILGALTALTVGALWMFQTGTVQGVPVQTFTTANVNWETCYVTKDVGLSDGPWRHAPGLPEPRRWRPAVLGLRRRFAGGPAAGRRKR